MLDGKRAVAQAIKAAWRNSPRATENPNFARLDLFCSDPLPSLQADFSHVRELTVGGASFTDATSDGVLGHFPRLQKLSINVTNSRLRTIPEALSGMTELIDLRITSNDRLATQEIARLGHLTNLENLELSRVLESAGALDVSRLSKLRSLTISGAYQGNTLPIGVLELPRLERLNLRATSVNSLPASLFDGAHDGLLSGLSLNWSWFPVETFKPLFEYVKNHPMHLIDREEMVMGYCKGQLRRWGGGFGGSFGLLDGFGQPDALLSAFLQQWTGAEARFNAIEALGNEYGDLSRQLDAWTKHYLPEHNFAGFSTTETLKNCWYNGLLKRYGVSSYSTTLDLPLMAFAQLPDLPVQGFSHVTTLKLTGLSSPLEQVRRFIGQFSQVQTLDLSGSQLTEMPITPGDLPALQHLDLRHTPLAHMDVSAMSQLQTLDLTGAHLQTWPTGAENLPGLTSLDLRFTQITTLPETALARDEAVIATNLTGTPLTPAAQAALTAAQARVENARGLSSGTLARFTLEEVPQAFPPTETATLIAQRLLPLPGEVPAGEGNAWLAECLQRVNGFSDEEASRAIEQLREDGASDTQISERIGGWHQTLEALTRELNGWLFIRESRGRDWVVSSHTRRLAALRILDCWREGLTARASMAYSALNLDGLQLGDLPALPTALPHVWDLNLTGIRLTEQGSNGFLGAFTNLRSLVLSGQSLQTLPQALNAMNLLERVELSANGITDPESVYSTLGGHQRLQRLDLSHNNLQTFSVASWSNLEWLDLRNNRLTGWPEGVLEARHLRTLNLSANGITSIPSEAFSVRHNALMSGTDLSDNSLSRDDLEHIRDYAQSAHPSAWLGYSARHIDELIDDLASNTESESDSEVEPAPIVPDEVIDAVESGTERLDPWLEMLEPQALVTHRALWNQLAAEPDNEAFFHLLAQLRNTQEFTLARADLTRRVWDVLRATASDGELRQTLFGMSNTHGTCVDGRILTFSNLEVKVFEHNALQGIGPGRLDQKGAALLRLSRQLFRLAKVEELANEKARGRHADPAEVRLEYRIGLTSGWDDGLELPGQPRNMLYGRPISGETLNRARAAVLERENKPGAFYEDLINRDYWVQYLKEKYPEAFSALERSAEEKQGQLEDAHEGAWGADYTQALESLGIELAIERSEKLIELSRKETGEIEPSVLTEPQPGTSKDLFKQPTR
ncbi:NEL-type E3 ubiquitin ligase domain-containing protein [Pseudomonas frederiksbergensis]|nr:NEL-type E3 ubiquitin ligase domain-containing protein [Pseudomonas frederiksbergensis]